MEDDESIHSTGEEVGDRWRDEGDDWNHVTMFGKGVEGVNVSTLK